MVPAGVVESLRITSPFVMAGLAPATYLVRVRARMSIVRPPTRARWVGGSRPPMTTRVSYRPCRLLQPRSRFVVHEGGQCLAHARVIGVEPGSFLSGQNFRVHQAEVDRR